MITALVIVKTAAQQLVYDTIGFSAWDIEESARELLGDEPCGVTVLVVRT